MHHYVPYVRKVTFISLRSSEEDLWTEVRWTGWRVGRRGNARWPTPLSALFRNFFFFRMIKWVTIKVAERVEHTRGIRNSFRILLGKLEGRDFLACNPVTGLYRPWGFQEFGTLRFQDIQHMKVIRLSALRTGRLPSTSPSKYSWYWFLLEAESTPGL